MKLETEASMLPLSAAPNLTEVMQQKIVELNRALHQATRKEADETATKDALRLYLTTKRELAHHTGRFGIVNNRVFTDRDDLIIPYLVGEKLVVQRVLEGDTKTLATTDLPPGTIYTDALLKRVAGFAGEVLDLEREVFGFDADQAEPIWITKFRDLGTLLEKVNETTNRNEAVYVLRFLVARLCSTPFEALAGAKNLRPEVRNLISQLVRFLNSPLSRRMPHLVRLLTRNVSALLAKPSLIDRLWNDTIDLAEIHVRGSNIVNELRRSTHHALGKRTLLLGKAYLEYLRTGGVDTLAQAGHPTLAPADEEARGSNHACRIVERIVEDLENLLGATEIIARIRDWQERYQEALVRCDSGQSLRQEMEEVVARGIRERNRWSYYHHLRVLRRKAGDFLSGARTADDFVSGLDYLLGLKPDDPGFHPQVAEQTVRSCVSAFAQRVQKEYNDELPPALESIIGGYGQKGFFETFMDIRRLRRRIAVLIDRGGFAEQRYHLYQLDCLLEEMGYLSLSHIATEYEEHGVDLRRCLEIIRICVLNLALDGKYSRELVDYAAMLTDPSRSYAEVANLLENIQRTYHKMVQRVTGPYEKMRDRLGLTEKDLRVVLGNMKRYMHDLNSMVHFCDLARSHILERIPDQSTRIFAREGAEAPSEEEFEILHLSHKRRIKEWVERGGSPPNLRQCFGGKGTGLAYISYLKVPTRDGFILPTTLAKSGLCSTDATWLEDQIAKHLRILEKDIAKRDGVCKRYGHFEQPLMLAVRGGSVFSMPGILPTVVFVGMNDRIARALAKEDPWHAYDSYRRFLASFARAVWGVDIEAFDLVEKAKRRYGVSYKKDLPWEGMKEVAEASKAVVRNKGLGERLDAVLDDPFKQLLHAVQAVFVSWSRETPRRYREIKGICHTWHTAVVVQEMASGNRQNDEVLDGMDETKASLTGVIPHTRLTDRGVRVFTGEIKFSAAGDDLVGGVIKPTSFRTMKELNTLMPMLNRRLRHTVAKLRRFQGTDQEIEFTVERGLLSVLQSRSAEMAADQELAAFADPGEEATRGIGIRGGGFRGLVAFDERGLKQLLQVDLSGRDDVDGILMLVENPSPDDIPLILQAGGLLTVKGGSSSHAAVAINGIEKKSYSAVMSAVGLRVNARKRQALIVDDEGNVRHRIGPGDILSIHGATGEVYIGSRPLSVKAL